MNDLKKTDHGNRDINKSLHLKDKLNKDKTLFRRCPALWKSKLKITMLFLRCLTLLKSSLKEITLIQRCSTLQILTLA